MKNTIIAGAIAALVGSAGLVSAEPAMLTASEMDNVTAGCGSCSWNVTIFEEYHNLDLYSNLDADTDVSEAFAKAVADANAFGTPGGGSFTFTSSTADAIHFPGDYHLSYSNSTSIAGSQ